MTFNAMKQAVKEICLLTSPEADTRVGSEINRHYRRLTTSLGLTPTRFVTRSANTSASTATVTFANIEILDRVLDVTVAASPRVIPEVSMDDLRNAVPGTGAPQRWALQTTDADGATIRMDTAPTATYNLQADGISTLADLSGTQEPTFPESYHDILVWYTIHDELLKKEKMNLALYYKKQAEDALAELRHHLADSPTRQTVQQAETALPLWLRGA